MDIIALPSTFDLTKDSKSYLAQNILKLESEMKFDLNTSEKYPPQLNARTDDTVFSSDP